MMRTYCATPKSPVREVLREMTGFEPPTFVTGYGFDNLTDEQTEELHSWCVDHVRPFWLTGTGLMEAAEAQVQEAVSNGNIPPPKKTGGAK